MDQDNQSPIGNTPVHKAILDGGQTRKFFEWLSRMEGDIEGVELEDSKVKAILHSFSQKIKGLKETTQATNIRVTSLELLTTNQQEEILKLQDTVKYLTDEMENLKRTVGDVDSSSLSD